MNYKTIPLITSYMKPKEGYNTLMNVISSNCRNGDYIFLSETPVSTIEGSILDESEYNPGLIAYILCIIWSKYIWGYLLGPLLGYPERTIKNLRNIPKEAIRHKQVILEEYGLKHALQPTAEAGVDLSNMAGTTVSLLPNNPQKSSERIQQLVYEKTSMHVEVVIIDTDPTYELLGHKYTTLPRSTNDVINNTGIFGYIARCFSKKLGSTILATTSNDSTDYLIELANIAEDVERVSGDDFFETVYNMKDHFMCDVNSITIDMLSKVRHVPGIIIRFKE